MFKHKKPANGMSADKVESGELDTTLQEDAQSGLHSDADTEIMNNAPQKRNWRGIVLALLVIAVISSIIVTASILTTKYDDDLYFGKPLTLDDVQRLQWAYRILNFQIVGDQLVYLSTEGSLMKFNLETLNGTTLLSSWTIQEKTRFYGEYSISPDLSIAYLQYDVKHMPDGRLLAKYDAVSLKESASDPRSIKSRLEIKPDPGSHEQPRIDFVKGSPDSDKLAFVYAGQIYMYHGLLNDLSTAHVRNVTGDLAAKKSMQFGVADWVYDEEILGNSVALWWSPDSQKLAFVAFDLSNVTEYEFINYKDEDNIYGGVTKIKYPKAGDPSNDTNTIVDVYIYNVDLQQSQLIVRPPVIPRDAYLTFVRWVDGDQLVIGWTNRVQNQAWITVTSYKIGKTRTVFHTTNNKGWIDWNKQLKNEPLIDVGSNSMLIILAREYNEHEYRGIAKISLEPSNTDSVATVQWLATPDFDVEDIHSYSSKTNDFFFTAIAPLPTQLNTYWGNTEGKVECLTCDLPNCTYSKPRFLANSSHYVLTCQGPEPLTIHLFRIERDRQVPAATQSLSAVSSTHVKTLFANEAARAELHSFALPRVEFKRLTLRNGTSEEMEVEAKLLLPPELNRTHSTTYPLLLLVYAGPGIQLVTTRFQVSWASFLAATAKFIVVSIDGRGTPGRGRRYEQSTYKQLGKIEIQDQLDAVKALIAENSYINESKVAAAGASYGGFAVGHLLGHPQNDHVINCGIAEAPVTDFRYYDTAYTERYLGRITENAGAYFNTNIHRHVKNMKGKRLLLIHGSADDNVHLINTMSLTKVLVDNDIDFESMIYPDVRHSLSSQSVMAHRNKKVFDFLSDCYNKSIVHNPPPVVHEGKITGRKN